MVKALAQIYCVQCLPNSNEYSLTVIKIAKRNYAVDSLVSKNLYVYSALFYCYFTALLQTLHLHNVHQLT